jgi:hypothetical protein
MDTSMTFKDFGIKMEKAFYGSTHGKNGGEGEWYYQIKGS